MKSLFSYIVIFTITSATLFAQCPEQQPATLSTVPDNCNQAIVLTPYIQNCQTVCFSGATATTSGGVSDLSCFGGTNTNDVWLTAPNPYNTVPNYDGSLVFRWIDWPNRTNGIPHPNISIHAEIAGSAGGGLVTINIDCTSPAPTQSNNFAQENAFCIQNSTTAGNQFYGVAGTIPHVSQIPPPSGVTINNIQYYLQVVPADGARGNYCFDVSTYKPGFLCGDILPINLTGSSGTITGSASGCLCASALNGTIFSNSSNNLPVPCGVESPSSAWYSINLPYACNKVTIAMGSWGGNDNYNIALLSGVDCPGSTSINPYTGATINTPGQTLQPGAVVEGSSCGQPLNLCKTLPAGTYYVYLSGASERPTFSVNVTVQEINSLVGNITSPQNNQSVCSGSNIELVSSGTSLPLAATCGQNVLWFYGTNPNFIPYNNQGTLLGAGTGTQTFPLPVNNTCAPVTYYIKGILSDNGTTPQSGCKQTTNTITVTIFPEIGQLTLLNQPCIISAAPRCPSFTINGQAGTSQVIGNFALDGDPVSFTVSNGLQGCSVTLVDTMRCSGNCDQPVATATMFCDPNDTYNFYVNVDFTPGSAASYTIVSSDGLEIYVTNTGTYLMGPFTNGTTVSLSVTNTEDVNCNIPLGSFTNNCSPVSCPNLTGVSATLNAGGSVACEGDDVLLAATVDHGVLNQDFKIQWYVNGNAIQGATTLSYSHTTDVVDGCAAELQTYSAIITCLMQNASPSQTPQLTAQNNINVFPIPVIGVDFSPSTVSCTVAPVDNCGDLDIVYSPTTNPAPGAGNTPVNYTVRLPGSPGGCQTSGSYFIQCPSADCTNSAGNGNTPADKVICYGESFQLSTAGASFGDGYSVGYAWTTTNPYGNLDLAVQTAINNNQYLGPYAANATPTFFNNGSTFQHGTYYFIPFVALNLSANQLAYTTSGSFSVSAPFSGNSASVTVPSTVAYCAGVTSYTANLTVQQQSNTGVLNAIDGVTGPIVSYSGGSTTNLNLNNNNYTGNPNGAVTTINGSGNLFWGSAINYSFTLRYKAVPFPTRCLSCADVGSPIVYNLLPPVNLSAPILPQICYGESINLNDYFPSSNIPGSFTWYDNDPSSGGNVIQNTIVIPSSSGTTYWALFKAADDSTCTSVISFPITPNAAPPVNQLTPPAAFCGGTSVDLTSYNSSVTTAPGTIVWYRGNPQNNPNAVRLPDALAADQQPTNGSEYCAKYTANSGCFAYSCLTFNVNPRPALTAPAVDPSSCEGVPFDLNTLEPGLTSAIGTFVWFEGNPNSGGTQLTPQQETEVLITLNNTDFCTIFTDDATTCENRICLEFNINPLPVLNAPGQQGPICSNEVIDLTLLQSQIINDNGNWEWKDENGNVIADPSNIQAQQNTFFSATFTSALTGCSDTVLVEYLVNPSPVLNTIGTQSVCVGDTVNLTSYENQLTASTGTFTWFKGDSITFGTQLTLAESQQQFPASFNVYRVVFENNFGCKDTQSLQFIINPLPVLNSVPQQRICFGIPANLTLLNDSVTASSGTFTWYPGINTQGTALSAIEAQSQTITGIVSYTVKFTDVNGCSAARTVVYSALTEVVGGTASYSCALNSLVVNLSGMSGGAGGGYNVSPNSPNQNGQTLANGSSFTVIVQDSLGCQQGPLTGSVSCLVCAVGNATAENDTACCNLALHLEASGIAASPNYTIAWGLSAVADGPITSSADVSVAAANGYVWQGNADGSLDFTNQCNIPAGNYYFTPFIIEDPVTTPLVWDTLNGCRPDGQICPTFSTNLDWKVDTLMGVFPNGDTTDLIRKLTEQLLGIPGGVDFDIDQALLTDLLGGALPCLQLTNLFAGNPNGTWSFIVNNIGTGPLTFNVPDFEILVDADSCAALNGVDQVVIVPGVSVVIPPNGQYVTISFQIPPLPSSFPAINSSCEAYGNTVQVYVTDDANLCTNSIDDKNKALTNVMLIPNPAMNLITISAELIKKENVSVTAIDVFGKEVLHISSAQQLKRFERTVDISAFAAGVYLFKVKAGNEEKTMRVIKQ